MTIILIENAIEIERCYPAFCELRPNLKDVQSFVDQIIEQQKEGYKIFAIKEGEEVVSCIGLRIATFLAWGKILYIDDLITKSSARNQGYGNLLMTYVINFAREQNCMQIHLDTGYTRHAAHKVYINNGFEFNCHHLTLNLQKL